MAQDRSSAGKWRDLVVNLLLAIGSTLFFLVLLEGGVRLAGQGPCTGLVPQSETASGKVRFHPIRQFELVSSATFTFERQVAIRHGLSSEYLDTWEGILYHINALGLRGDETSLDKPAGTLRIVVLGDSVAFGWGIEQADTLSKQLQVHFNQDSPSTHIQVWNAGVPGYATWQELSYLVEKGSAWRPDLILVPFVFNDVDGNNDGMQTAPFGVTRVGQMLTLWTQKSALLCFLRNQALEFRLKHLNPCQGPNCWGATTATLDGLVVQSRKLGSRIAVVAYPMRLQVEPSATPGYYDRALGSNPQQNYQDIIARLCAERDIAYLDLLPAMQSAAVQGTHSLFLDADHPNTAGSKVAAEAVYGFVKDLLKK
jgi:lysophospholipase L1-like esterase